MLLGSMGCVLWIRGVRHLVIGRVRILSEVEFGVLGGYS